ncbi:hypothetical protein MRX96_029233 [Rhipicephalus microplus]
MMMSVRGTLCGRVCACAVTGRERSRSIHYRPSAFRKRALWQAGRKSTGRSATAKRVARKEATRCGGEGRNESSGPLHNGARPDETETHAAKDATTLRSVETA